MFDLALVGFILTILVLLDIVLHIYYDYQKIQTKRSVSTESSQEQIPKYVMLAAGGSTILLFVVVFIICLCWILTIELSSLSFFGFFFNFPDIVWQTGFLFLCFGIILHGWSRSTRREMASSWDMSNSHMLVKSGPYRFIRHPSYTSYIICFIGIVMMIPSILTSLSLIGIPGYYFVAKSEECLLIDHFGDEYQSYMKGTGMFFPKLRNNQN